MGSDPVVTVEVTISEELRGLLAIMRGAKPPIDPLTDPDVDPQPDPLAKVPLTVEAALVEAAPPKTASWPEVMLRRDGQRPILFRGLPVLTRSCTAPLLPGTAEQRLTVYLAEGDLLYASLVFEPPEDACAHASHRCQPIRDRGEFEVFLKDWLPELSFETVFATGSPHQQNLAAGQVAVRAAFNSMAADCLCKGVLHS